MNAPKHINTVYKQWEIFTNYSSVRDSYSTGKRKLKLHARIQIVR